jgi:hypothetical protein
VTRDGWEIVVSLRRDGWGLSAHRGSPDAWEGHPGRWATEAEARAAAEGWDPGGVARRRPAAAVRAPEPEPDEDTNEDAAPQPAVALPGQLALNFGGV